MRSCAPPPALRLVALPLLFAPASVRAQATPETAPLAEVPGVPVQFESTQEPVTVVRLDAPQSTRTVRLTQGVWSQDTVRVTYRETELCQTPCTVPLPPGVLRLRTYGPRAVAAEDVFTLAPPGGTVRIRSGNRPGWTAGWVLTALGAVGVIAALAELGAENRLDRFGIVLGASAGVLGVGAGLAGGYRPWISFH